MISTLLTTASADAVTADPTMSLISTIVPFALMFVVFYFLLIRPQKKREKQTNEMRSSIDVGDDVVTIGGIVGTVVSIKEDTLVIETSGDRNKIRIQRWAIQGNITPKTEG